MAEMTALPKLPEILEAERLLARYLSATPLVKAPSLGNSDTQVFLKLETALPTGSFKPRGAIYALAKNLERGEVREIVASSTGNHGAAVAFAAKTLGVKATIFLPENPNPVKRKKIEELGARIVCNGSIDLVGASQAASEYSRQHGSYFLHDATDPDLPTGPATIGLEIMQQMPNVSAVFVAMGDTALIRGIGAGIKSLSRHADHRSAGRAGTIVCAFLACWQTDSDRHL